MIANLVLIPRALAGLTDHRQAMQTILQYRAYELYGWHPDEQPTPKSPPNFRENWRNPEPDPESDPRGKARTAHDPSNSAGTASQAGPVSFDKMRRWARDPNSNVHRIIVIVLHHGPLSRTRLETEIARRDFSKSPRGAVASLMSNKGNSYGRVFQERENLVSLHPEIEDEVRKHHWAIE